MPRPPHTSASARALSDTLFSNLVRRAAERGIHVSPLHVGDTYREPLPAARAEAQRCAEHPRLHNYAPVQGDPVLLDAIQAHLRERTGLAVPRDHIQVMAGATTGLNIVVSALLDPGDELLLPAPFWPVMGGITRARGATPVEVPLFTRLGEPGFDPVATLAAAITPRTAAIYLNTPHNPTGRVLDEAAIEGIAELAERHGLWVISDEVYADLWYTPEPPRPVWAHPKLRERCIATHSVSKSHGLAGARIGFTHGPAEAMTTIRGVQTFTTYCAARPMQIGAANALSEGDAWLAEARTAYARAGRRAAERLGIPAPEGGTFLFFDVSPYLRHGETLTGFLERCMEAGVLLTPGSASGSHFHHWVRLCFTAVAPDELDQALDRLETVLKG